MRILTLTMVALLVAVHSCPAQVQLPVYESQRTAQPAKPIVFEETKSPADVRHGSLVLITLNDATKVRGVLVRTDSKKDRIYVRSVPGAAPRAILRKDVKKIEKGVTEIRDEIRAAVFKEEVLVAEIHPMVVSNGLVRTIHYFGPTLSAEEKNRLRDLEEAENELARLDQLNSQRHAIVQNEVAIQGQRLTSLALINSLLWQQVQSGFWVEPPSRSIHVLKVRHDQPELTKIMTLLPSPDSLTKARDAFRIARSHAVFDQDRIIAVLLED